MGLAVLPGRLEKELDTIPNEKVRKIVMENLRAIAEDNRRDFRF